MKRIPREILEEINRLSTRGDSLRAISRELGLAKSTVYYHTRKKLGRRYVQMAIDSTPTRELGEFLGLFATDGSFYVDRKRYHYTLSISLSRVQLVYAKMVQRMVRGIIGKRPRLDAKKKMVQLVLRGKAILAFLKNYLEWEGRKAHSIRFKESVFDMPVDFLRGVLRGLLSGDGNVYPPKHRIAFGVVSKELAHQFVLLIGSFGVTSHLYPVRYKGKKTLYHVHITGLPNIRKFKIRVGFTDPSKKAQLSLTLRR